MEEKVSRGQGAGSVSKDSAAARDVERLTAELDALRTALAREERVSAALREVGKALGATLDLDDLLELILGRLTDLLDADRSTLYLVDDENDELVSQLVIGDAIKSIRVKVGHGIAGIVAKTGKPIRIADAYQDPRFEREWDLLTGYRTTSMLAVPLKNHLGRTIGVIQVLNKATGSFTGEDEALLTALSTQAAVAIDNSRLFLSLIQKNRQLVDTKEQLERRVTDLQLLFELERATGRATTLDELVQASLSVAIRACDARGGAMLLAEEESGDVVQFVLDDERPDQLERFGVKSGEGFLGAVMAEREATRVEDAAGDERFSDLVELRYPFEVDSVMALPLDGETDAIGAIGLFSKRGGRSFTREDESLMALVSANVSTAVRLFRASEARERGARLTAIGRLLSQVIHDFKTPMTVISGHVQLMQDQQDPKARREHARQVLKQFEALTSMQREVLEFARGERSIFIRKVFLHQFFDDIRSQLAHSVDGRAIELEMEVEPKLVARFDQGRVMRAVLNLTRNAVEAMAATGGTLRIYAHMQGDDLVMGVSDTGPGIPTEIEGRLFQSFVTAGKVSGTGLGLAIVKKIVDEHGGHIITRSSERGATFELHFPQSALPASDDGEPRKGAEESSLEQPEGRVDGVGRASPRRRTQSKTKGKSRPKAQSETRAQRKTKSKTNSANKKSGKARTGSKSSKKSRRSKRGPSPDRGAGVKSRRGK